MLFLCFSQNFIKLTVYYEDLNFEDMEEEPEIEVSHMLFSSLVKKKGGGDILCFIGKYVHIDQRIISSRTLVNVSHLEFQRLGGIFYFKVAIYDWKIVKATYYIKSSKHSNLTKLA